MSAQVHTSTDAITVLGAGAWGTALACLYAREGRRTRLYARDPGLAAEMGARRRNDRFLPGVALPGALEPTPDLGAALDGAGTVLLAVPAQSLRGLARTLAAARLAESALLVLCSKGIERDTGLFGSAVIGQTLPGSAVAVLSGPSFADDVARGLPTAVTIAAQDDALADSAARRLSAEGFRGYASADLRGVEAGGALKNVLAIAAGIVAGRGLGASALAATVTRGFAELRRLGAALGGQPDTLTGLSGLGDLVLTCSGPQSRNFAYGAALGRGADVSSLKLAEGVFTAGIAASLARDMRIEAPLVDTVADILAARRSVDEAVRGLLSRPLRREAD